MSLRIILSVEALEPHLSGIGRYNWALASRMASLSVIEDVRFWRSGHWIADPAGLLDPDRPLPRDWRPRWWRNRSQRGFGRTHLFHGPNYFLPDWAEGGVVTVHDLSVLRYPETHPADRIAHFERRFSQSLAIAGHVITDSDTVRREVIDMFALDPAQVTAIPLGVDAAFHPRDAAEIVPILTRYDLTPNGYALCVSTVEPRKRIAQLLQAWSLLPPALRHRWPLMVTGGKGWLSEDIRALMEQGQAQGWVRYLGFVPDEDLPILYAGAGLFLYPSVYEGFGLPPVEAMASGVPVLVANASCLPEVTGGAAMLVEPDDVDGFARHITQALEDEAWRAQARAAGLAVAAKYDWDACVRDTVALYGRLYNSKRSA
ncbi:glycosyltransferase family 4 protein [Sphingobium sp. YR768]|uniref:glycosyltransferase family 4 protein n=1 Tax=Sphingobium sp. YR768 TaxID=1884365 RepID=UPI0008D106F9|nr:glycosyltransferase family 1 protein [Sphingobium sp. YR768]SER92132.1 alpha-1,3-rhamnosyl/mannosyltransferase [Sphingobium sp. YR768]